MNKLIDTCGWVEWLTEGKLANSFAIYFKKLEEVIVPSLVQYELYKWICREKNEELALCMIGVTEKAKVVSFDTSLALYAADLSKQYKLAMGDAIIYATSLKEKALLITSDKHFKDLPNVEFFNKSPS